MDEHPCRPCRTSVEICKLQIAHCAISSNCSHRAFVDIFKRRVGSGVELLGKMFCLLYCNLCHLRVSVGMRLVFQIGDVAKGIDVVVSLYLQFESTM